MIHHPFIESYWLIQRHQSDPTPEITFVSFFALKKFCSDRNAKRLTAPGQSAAKISDKPFTDPSA
jgi:hypothetical protein